MTRQALTTTWVSIGSEVTEGFVQNLGANPILMAFAASLPADDSEVGFLLQAGDYLPVSGLVATNLYLRTFSGVGEANITDAADPSTAILDESSEAIRDEHNEIILEDA